MKVLGHLGHSSFLIFVSGSAIYDRVSQGGIHPVSLWGAILIFASNALFFGVIQSTEVWASLRRG